MSEPMPLPVDPDLPTDSPEKYVEATVSRAGTSFYWGMRRLAPARRAGIFAVYAFCRDVDDIADGDLPPTRKTELLAAWRAEVEDLFRGSAHHPIGRALVQPVRDFGLRKEDFLAVIDGMETDAHARVRIADTAALDLYCDRVACAVGRLCVRLFGMQEQQGIALAHALGMALQLTNILRDIAEDAGRDRVYLPADGLAEAGAAGEGVEDILTSPGLGQLCERIAQRAEDLFTEADAIMKDADPKAVRPALMMMQVYRRILQRLRRRGWTDLRRDVGPSKAEKILIALRYGVFG